MDPLAQALKDSDAYVRKTAVMCVPKVYELTPELVEQHKLIEEVQSILEKETNSVVISNTLHECYLGHDHLPNGGVSY